MKSFFFVMLLNMIHDFTRRKSVSKWIDERVHLSGVLTTADTADDVARTILIGTRNHLDTVKVRRQNHNISTHSAHLKTNTEFVHLFSKVHKKYPEDCRKIWQNQQGLLREKINDRNVYREVDSVDTSDRVDMLASVERSGDHLMGAHTKEDEGKENGCKPESYTGENRGTANETGRK